MPTDTRILMRRYLRFSRYLPVRCTVLSPEHGEPQTLAGITRNVNAGGLEILLPESLTVKTPVSVQISNGDALYGYIVSVGTSLSTVLGPRFPHGVAFEQPVEPSLVRQWVSHPNKRVHQRAQVQFDVEYTRAGKTAQGNCLNLCQGGMFIITESPAEPGTEVLLRFTLPDQSDPLFIRARVAWMIGEEQNPAVCTGMGVQFLGLEPAEAQAIANLVDRLCSQAAASESSRSLPPTE